ncbi:MAG: SurA N-terminal domain-containing protein [Alphaproteobacteria bacterium]
MLHVLRAHKNSKVVWAALTLIIGVFTFWGVGVGINAGQSVNDVATVNGRPVSQVQLLRAENNLVQTYRDALKGQFTPEIRKGLNLRQRALDSLIDREVLAERAEQLGFTIGDQELRDSIATNPAFLVGGRFDKEAYLRALRYASLTPADFEETMRKELAIERLQNVVWDGVSVDEQAVRDEILSRGEKRVVSFVKVKASDYTMKVPATDEDLRKFYDANLTRFTEPERVRIEMIAYPADKIPGVAAPTDEEVVAWYDAHVADRFTQQAEVRARHVLVKVDEGADAATRDAAKKKIEGLRKQVQDGVAFEKVAREHSEDPGTAAQGGELGFFGRGRMVKPFEDAAFSLKPGQVSEVVETPFGFHLIQVEEVHEEKKKSLDEVRADVVSAIRGERGRDAAASLAKEDRAAWAGGKSADEIAGARGLVVDRPDPIARGGALPGVGTAFAVNNALWDLSPGSVTEPVDANGTWVVAKLVEKLAPSPKPFDSVKLQVETAWRLQEGQKLARDAAQKLLAAAKVDGSLFKAAAAQRGEVERSEPFPRSGPFVPGLGASSDLKQKAFAMTDANKLASDVVEVAGDSVVMELAEVTKPSDDDVKKELAQAKKTMLEQRRGGVFTRYLQELKKKAQVVVDRQKVDALPAI